MTKHRDFLQGTLDMPTPSSLYLWLPCRGTASCCASSRTRKTGWKIQQGSLYPALYRLERQGWITSEWGESETKRRAKYCRLTSAGRRRLHIEADRWNRVTDVIAGILGTKPEEV